MAATLERWGPLLVPLAVALALAGLARMARRGAAERGADGLGALGALVQVALGGAALAAVAYATLYLLSLVAGFYESLTCKVVSLPACEDPLPLPAWLRLPSQSVGGVMGILPLVAVFLAKTLQPRSAPPVIPEGAPLREELARRGLHALRANLGLLLILAFEIWLAGLRGAAEASDRQVRLALGLDAELPASYLSVARWGAVVLALGLSAVVVYLGILARHARLLATDALGRIGYGAVLAGFLARWAASSLSVLADAAVALWRAVAIATGRAALKLQDAVLRTWALAATALGRVALKLQDTLLRAWALVATSIGRLLVGIASLPGRAARGVDRMRRRSRRVGRGGAGAWIAAAALAGAVWPGAARAETFVVLPDATGSEAGRLEERARLVLSWADPDPNRSLLERGDRLVVVPVRSPGRLDPAYPAVFSARYPSDQLGRYGFFTDLRAALPAEADERPGTALSEALRAAAAYLAEVPPEERVLVVFGNGEDHVDPPVGPTELAPGLEGARVAHLDLALDQRERYEALYRRAGASRVVLLDLAATRSLGVEELAERMGLE